MQLKALHMRASSATLLERNVIKSPLMPLAVCATFLVPITSMKASRDFEEPKL